MVCDLPLKCPLASTSPMFSWIAPCSFAGISRPVPEHLRGMYRSTIFPSSFCMVLATGGQGGGGASVNQGPVTCQEVPGRMPCLEPDPTEGLMSCSVVRSSGTTGKIASSRKGSTFYAEQMYTHCCCCRLQPHTQSSSSSCCNFIKMNLLHPSARRTLNYANSNWNGIRITSGRSHSSPLCLPDLLSHSFALRSL